MATKLYELKVTSVDFVDRGANPDAHITLYKRDSSGDAPAEKPEEPTVPAQDAEPPKAHKSVWKRFVSALGKMAGLGQDDINAAVEEIEKSDGDQPAESPEAPTKPEDTAPAEEQAASDGIAKNAPKGEEEPMVDTSKMTPAEKMIYDDIVKRYSVEDGEVAKGATQTEKACGGGSGSKSKTKKEDSEMEDEEMDDEKKKKKSGDGVKKSADSQDNTEDIYKGLHPLVAAELQRLRQRADDEDARQLTEVAKKYEIIGKKPEELVPVLKALKDAGGTAYDDMIGVLDASVEAVNKSGVFAEIGKSGSYGADTGAEAWSKIEKKADEIQAQNPKLERHQAIDMACMQNATLVHEYENEM